MSLRLAIYANRKQAINDIGAIMAEPNLTEQVDQLETWVEGLSTEDIVSAGDTQTVDALIKHLKRSLAISSLFIKGVEQDRQRTREERIADEIRQVSFGLMSLASAFIDTDTLKKKYDELAEQIAQDTRLLKAIHKAYAATLKDEYTIELVVKTTPCPICKRPMLGAMEADLFPKKAPLKKQMDAAGVVPLGHRLPGTSTRICKICTKENRAEFTCYICKQPRKVKELYDQHYDKCFCKVCYATVPAKKWDEYYYKVFGDREENL